MTREPNGRILTEMDETAAQWAELLDGMRRRIEAIDEKIKSVAEDRTTADDGEARKMNAAS